MDRPLYIASCSFGKDSIATILLALEHNEPLDRAVFVEVMFDNERNISGEIPEHIEWVYSTAIPKLEAMGVKVDVVRSKNDYIGCFFRKLTRSKYPERIGKVQGFPYSMGCKILRDCKMPAVKKYWAQFSNVVKYVGIASDEKNRLERLNGQISLLAKYGITEKKSVGYVRGSRAFISCVPHQKKEWLLVLPECQCCVFGAFETDNSTPIR